jgi:hypothetical protein
VTENSTAKNKILLKYMQNENLSLISLFKMLYGSENTQKLCAGNDVLNYNPETTKIVFPLQESDLKHRTLKDFASWHFVITDPSLKHDQNPNNQTNLKITFSGHGTPHTIEKYFYEDQTLQQVWSSFSPLVPLDNFRFIFFQGTPRECIYYKGNNLHILDKTPFYMLPSTIFNVTFFSNQPTYPSVHPIYISDEHSETSKH